MLCGTTVEECKDGHFQQYFSYILAVNFIGTDCTGSCKSNNHPIMATTTPFGYKKIALLWKNSKLPNLNTVFIPIYRETKSKTTEKRLFLYRI
jgi:hypothetical protein